MNTRESFLAKCAEVRAKKEHDYARAGDKFSAFHFVGTLLDWCTLSGLTGADAAFVGLIAVKLVRLMELLGRNRSPQNESVEDSFVDLVNYCVLWADYRHSEEEAK